MVFWWHLLIIERAVLKGVRVHNLQSEEEGSATCGHHTRMAPS